MEEAGGREVNVGADAKKKAQGKNKRKKRVLGRITSERRGWEHTELMELSSR